jgi:hypothetical protein
MVVRHERYVCPSGTGTTGGFVQVVAGNDEGIICIRRSQQTDTVF